MPNFTWQEVQLAEALWRVGSVKVATRPEDYFTLKLHETEPDAPKSPIYLNLRTADHPKNPGPLTPEIMVRIGDLLRVRLPRQFDCFADLPDAGKPFGDQWERVTSGLEVPPRRLTLYKEHLPDGARRIAELVDGDYAAGMSCLVLDDLITKAHTKFEGINALRAAGLIVEDILVVVDRQQGGAQQLAEQGVRLHSIFKLVALLGFYLECGKISREKYDELIAYLRANGGQF